MPCAPRGAKGSVASFSKSAVDGIPPPDAGGAAPPPALRFVHALKSPTVILARNGFAFTTSGPTAFAIGVVSLWLRALRAPPAPRKCAAYKLPGVGCIPALVRD